VARLFELMADVLEIKGDNPSASAPTVGPPRTWRRSPRTSRRDPYAVDLERVFAAAKQQGQAVEINAYPPAGRLSSVRYRV
jgi:histidinol phosphatase-like PHP family hydrolase